MASLSSGICQESGRTCKTISWWPAAYGNARRQSRRAITQPNLFFFWKSRPDLPTPGLQPLLEECAFASERTGHEYGLPAGRAAAWTLAPGLVRPESCGHLALTGNRPQDRLAIHANFLGDRRAVDALLRAVELCRGIGNAAPLAPYRKRELMPGPRHFFKNSLVPPSLGEGTRVRSIE
jgi:choline dehydrogenase-like flavoprotein